MVCSRYGCDLANKPKILTLMEKAKERQLQLQKEKIAREKEAEKCNLELSRLAVYITNHDIQIRVYSLLNIRKI